MNIISIFGACPNITYNSEVVARIVYDTMLELGVYVDEVRLIEKNIPYLNSTSPNINVANIMSNISNSNGVIFISTSHLYAPSSIMQTFFDYFSLPLYKNVLKNKNCFIITVSKNDNGKKSNEYLSNCIQDLGGFDSTKIFISENVANSISLNNDYKHLLEKYVEDFYRYAKQGRLFFNKDLNFKDYKNDRIDANLDFSKDISNTTNIQNNLDNTKNIYESNLNTAKNVYENNLSSDLNTNTNYQNNFKNKTTDNYFNQNKLNNSYAQNENYAVNKPYPKNPYIQNQKNTDTKLQNNTLNNVYNNDFKVESNEDEIFLKNILSDTNEKEKMVSNLNNNNNNNDVNELTKFFNNERKNIIDEPLINTNENNVTYKSKSLKQKTQSLIHYFQPQLASGLGIEIQFNISGNEVFDGFIRINNNQCDYFDGNSNSPDITIMSNDDTWAKIIDNQLSTQRAFMTGQIKVRGNFVLLSKFDQIFKV